jgi:GLPGLI family protein
MKNYLAILLVVVFAGSAHAQQTYITKGKIEYEKVVNTLKVIEEQYTGSDNVFGEAIKKSTPKTNSTFYDLYFNEEKSLYKPGKEVVGAQKPPEWIIGQAIDNIVFNDLTNQTTTTQKNVFENTYLIKDSLKTLKWKITNDTRTIAGFECRKATTVMMDSVFVVAFFTEQILSNSGPEGFNGLPGMILGIAIPRLHATWYATKLELIEVKEADITAPKKGKAVNYSQLSEQLAPLMKRWGSYANRYMWQITI